jgi:N-acetylglutamate synthase/N-acetylornithine aminotransferase
MLDRIRHTLRIMRRARTKITVVAVARQANVSRTFLYQNPEARALVANAAVAAGVQRDEGHAAAAAHAEQMWRERALNAEDSLADAHREIIQQRATIGELLGRVRDLERDLPEDSVQHLLTQNNTLKQQTRQLSLDNQRLTERLQGARDNNRFLDMPTHR